MAITNSERVGKAMDLLKAGLVPFIVRECKAAFPDNLDDEARKLVGTEAGLRLDKPIAEWDTAPLLKLMWEAWRPVFQKTLGRAERSLVSELRDARNEWAHQKNFTYDDVIRILDSACRLLTSVSASEAAELEDMRDAVMRLKLTEQTRTEKRKNGATLIKSNAASSLKPWRELITPHQDVASGNFQQAEFAADLWQVYLGQGSSEYKNPGEFFKRTFLTQSLKRLLAGAMQRLADGKSDPVVQLKTNFGGGKTHAMLALFHLFSGAKPGEMQGIEEIASEAGIRNLPKVRRVVLVGNKISPGNPAVKSDGTEVRTLWGELAWQLGGRAAYERIENDDRNATNPGDVLRELLDEYGPALILIDEWIAYARQLHDNADLPGGSFETHFTFAQALTESAKLAKRALLVVSVPASDSQQQGREKTDDVEVGGQRGREALDKLYHVIGRVESTWRPATAEEGFEIVRRRLFEPMTTREQHVSAELVADAFHTLYQSHPQEFPSECREADYKKRLIAAYPIHPEVFDRLYTDWSTLVKFQRTRGVLRLMATVIHSLWEKGDANPLIMPANISIDDQRVQFELTRYLSDNWTPVIEKDVDGADSLPRRLDNEVSNLGKLLACRRVTRTVYLGSAPLTKAANVGLEDRRVKLGCVMPGENPAVFGDALRRLSAQATYMYNDGGKYWFSTQPTVTKLAEERVERYRKQPDSALLYITTLLKHNLKDRGGFSRIHILPQSSQDVPDEESVRLVVLSPEHPYQKDGQSAALTAAQTTLETRGNAARIFRNTLVFLAADKARLADLEEAIFSAMAWQSIVDDKEFLDLSPNQVRQATERHKNAVDAAYARLPETYIWLLTPFQETPQSEVKWERLNLSRVGGGDSLAARAFKKLKNDGLLAERFGYQHLRKELDNVPLWRGNHVSIRQLLEDFAKYPYLPRLTEAEALFYAISNGLGILLWEAESFAYAESYDEKEGRYLGLSTGKPRSLYEGDQGILVRPEIARKQEDEDSRKSGNAEPKPTQSESPGFAGTETGKGSVGKTGFTFQPIPEPLQKPKRFYGEAELDPTRLGRDASRIAEEIVAHLVNLPGAKVKISIEIEAANVQEVPPSIQRTVTENAHTLHFNSFGFEDEG